MASFKNVWFVYGEEGGGSWTCLALVAVMWNYKGGVEEGLLLGFAISLGQRKWYSQATDEPCFVYFTPGEYDKRREQLLQLQRSKTERCSRELATLKEVRHSKPGNLRW